MALSWSDRLQAELIKAHGKQKAGVLIKKYTSTFPSHYQDDSSIETVLADILVLERLGSEKIREVVLYQRTDKERPLRVRLFQWQQQMPLSDILPILENFGLRTFNEHLYKIKLPGGKLAWISDFSVAYTADLSNIPRINALFQQSFNSIYEGVSENDGFNQLIFSASLSWREIMILRLYAKYLRQIAFRFSQTYIEKTLVNHSALAVDLVAFFKAMHDPKGVRQGKKKADLIEKRILHALEAVTSLDEDKIIRRLLELMKATLRTNYFQTINGMPKPYISVKLGSTLISGMPLPCPLYEIYVYSRRFEGIHLRKEKVARGGIRWSDRLEDFRTEILGLMKAQVVKNSIIVPSGAKGGFVLTPASPIPPQDIKAEVVFCYQSFIRGLLDLTDNIIDQKTVSPESVVCYDEADPYLVVAADKGTASFSDIANRIAEEYQFWLGDAFASGGKTGYDHKKMGITAKGAWESIKRHFRELNVDVRVTTIRVVGIGDMSGDVFGNGILYSRKIKLIAAFDHRHIFLDPDPDPEKSYRERERLFKLPSSSWENYNPALISKGGGVFKRSGKYIPLSPQVKAALGIEEDSLTPNELIRAVLKSPVDLLFNGGIGTYVKASFESQAEASDRTNDYCRINGSELRCKVVGEGGNLGFTQCGRIEYAKTGGLINTDFIDNSGGVDCSDHEVNLKILLNQAIRKKLLSLPKRNQLLASLTKDISELVLADNASQALTLSFTAYHANKNMGLHTLYVKDLEVQGLLDRQVEFLPDDKKLIERKAAGESLTRPELAVLLSYTKIHIKQEILKSKLDQDAYFRQVISTVFPQIISKKFHALLNEHTLARDIIATQLSNQIVNAMGMTFVYRLQVETGATVEEIIRAYTVAASVFGTQKLEEIVAHLDFKIPLQEQYDMLYNIRNLVSLATRWFLRHADLMKNLPDMIEHFSTRVKILENLIPSLMSGSTKEYLETLSEQFLKAGLPREYARRIATYRAIYATLNVIEVATKHRIDLVQTAKVYFAVGGKFNLVWFRDQIGADSHQGHWSALARLTLRDELDAVQQLLTLAVFKQAGREKNGLKLMEKWLASNQRIIERWESMLSLLHSSTSVEYSMFFITIRELANLI